MQGAQLHQQLRLQQPLRDLYAEHPQTLAPNARTEALDFKSLEQCG